MNAVMGIPKALIRINGVSSTSMTGFIITSGKRAEHVRTGIFKIGKSYDRSKDSGVFGLYFYIFLILKLRRM